MRFIWAALPLFFAVSSASAAPPPIAHWKEFSYSSPRQIRKGYTFQWAKDFQDKWKASGIESKGPPQADWDAQAESMKLTADLKVPEGTSLVALDEALKITIANKTGSLRLDVRWMSTQETDSVGKIVPPDGQPLSISVEAARVPGSYLLMGGETCERLDVVPEYLGEKVPDSASLRVQCEAGEGDQVTLTLQALVSSSKPQASGGWRRGDKGLVAVLPGYDAPSEALQVESTRIRFVRVRQPNKHWYAHASLMLIGGYQFVAAGNQLSAQAEWNPRFRFKERWGVTGWLGVSPLKSVTTNGIFFSARYGAEANYYLPKGWMVGLGGGAQTWFAEIGTSPSIRLSVSKTRGEAEDRWRWLDRFSGSLEYILVPGMNVLEAKVGIEMGRTR